MGIASVGDGSADASASTGLGAEVDLLGRAHPPLVSPAAFLHRKARPSSRTRSQWLFTLAVLTLVVDVVTIELGYILAKAFKAEHFDVGPVLLHQVDTRIFLTALAWPAVFAMYGLYDLQRATHVAADLQRLIQAVIASVLLVILIAFVTGMEISRGFVISLFGFTLVTTFLGRSGMRRLVHRLNARTLTSQRTVIIGTNDEARAMARSFRRRPWMGFDLCGFLEVAPSGLASMDGLPVLGDVGTVAEVVREQGIGAVVIAGTAAGGDTLQQVDAAVSGTHVAVRVSPGLPNLGASRVVLEPVDGMALFSLRRQRFSRRQRLTKRLVDVITAFALLIVTSPMMLMAWALIRVSDPGPVLFRQRRIGSQGRPFTIYKFRTMVVDAERHRLALVGENEADGLLFKMRRDPRVTPVGRCLRRFSIDELPQLFNVLRGDMSMVGPRPALPEEVERYDDQRRARLRVKPGLTGLWQVNGRHDLVFDDYVRYDLFYVANWSLMMDLYIIARTIPAMISGRGSY
jgi:exopolysaccharide biosynthesis polyprenyl glycosylphosphotransferase